MPIDASQLRHGAQAQNNDISRTANSGTSRCTLYLVIRSGLSRLPSEPGTAELANRVLGHGFPGGRFGERMRKDKHDEHGMPDRIRATPRSKSWVFMDCSPHTDPNGMSTVYRDLQHQQ